MITLVALCYTEDEITLGTIRALEEADFILLRTGKCALARYLTKRKIPFETLDALYESSDDFDELDRRSAALIREKAGQGRMCLGVFDPASDSLARLIKDESVEARPYSSVLGRFAPFLKGGEQRAVPAAELRADSAQGDLAVTEIDSRFLMGEVKLKLLDIYGERHRVCFSPAPGEFKWIPLEDADRMPDRDYGHRCALLLPAAALTDKTRFDATDLVKLMGVLRSPGGCPWDREQTHGSLRTYLIEEAYETAAAIDEEDWAHTAEELGDVLLQVVFQANIGEQYGTFTLGDITTSICEKMIRRHRHIFGDADCEDAAAVTAEWEKIKAQERKDETVSDAMKAVSVGLPSLMRAEKVQKRAARCGFDHASPEQALDALEERLKDLRERGANTAEKCGDLLFACADVLRVYGEECEGALMRATERFIKRFQRMEELAAADKLSLNTLTTEEMRVYWIRAAQ